MSQSTGKVGNRGNPGSRYLSSQIVVEEGVRYMQVLSDTAILEGFASEVYSQINETWLQFHDTDMRVTEEQFLRYVYTAIVTRVSRVTNARYVVNGERFNIRCDDAWAMPASIANVLSGIGNVILESPVARLVPSLDLDSVQSKVMTQAEQISTTNALRAMANDDRLKLVFASAIEGNRDGDPMTMALLPIRDGLGRLQALHYHVPIDAVAAASYLILGIWPVGWDGVAPSGHPTLLPPWSIGVATIAVHLSELSRSAVR